MSAPAFLPLVTTTSLALDLRNSQIARSFSITPAWKTLRLGIKYVFTSGSNTNIINTPRLTIGFCSGSALYNDAVTGHFAGIQTNNATMPYYSDAATYAIAANYSATIRTLKKVGSVETQFSANIESTNTWHCHDRNSINYKTSVIYFDLTRPTGPNNSGSYASGTYTANYGRNTDYGNSNYFNIQEPEFLIQLASSTPKINVGGWTYGSAGTFLINEIQDGYFDSVNISWDHENPDSEVKIKSLGIAVLA